MTNPSENTVQDTHDVIIFGTGITGLTCAFRLLEAGLNPIVLETSQRIGGSIKTERVGDYLLEIGPNSYTQKPEALRLVQDVGLEDDLIESPLRDNPRYLFNGEKLCEAPMGLVSFLTHPMLTWRAKLKVMFEPFRFTRPPEDESVEDFITRYLGKEMLDNFVAPFVSGIYAGRPDRMSMRAAFPIQYGLAARSGSMMRGGVAYMLEKKRKIREEAKARGEEPPPRRPSALCSFPNGLIQLPEALAGKLGERVHCGVEIESVRDDKNGYVVSIKTLKGERIELKSKKIVFASPAYSTTKVLNGWKPELTEALSAINYMPLTVVHVGIPLDSVDFKPRGFGFLIPRGRGIRALGVLWTSSVFKGRAPKGHALMTMFYGGATDPEVGQLSDEEMHKEYESDLKKTMGWNGTGELLKITRYDAALPEYDLDYLAKLERINSLAAKCDPPLHFIGNYMGRISLPDCIRTSGEKAAELL